MAPIAQMTWNWKWKASATAATALAGWLASPVPSPAPASPAAASPAAARRVSAAAATSNAAVVSDIEAQAQRLSVRLAPAPPYVPAGRNLFHFEAARPVRRRAPAAAVPAVPPPPVKEPFPLRLTGIAVDVVDGVEQRTAIVSNPGGLELAAKGQNAAPGYRVIEIGDGWADVERTGDGVRERLTLR